MDTTELVLRSWCNYISFVERNRYTVVWDDDSAYALSSSVFLRKDSLLVKMTQKVFALVNQLMSKYAVSDTDQLLLEMREESAMLGLTWPFLWNVQKSSSQTATKLSYPLFIVDITEKFLESFAEAEESGEKEFEIYLPPCNVTPVTEQLIYILSMDLEEVEKKTLFSESVNDFLETLFLPSNHFSLEESSKKILEKWADNFSRRGLEFKAAPYVFEVEWSETSKLRKELWALYKSARRHRLSLDSSSPAKMFLLPKSGVRREKSLPIGLCQAKTPDDEQIDILRTYESAPICPVFGPPGTGKTFLTREILAQQIVSRALHLVAGKEKTCSLLVASSVNKATDNVVDFFKDSHSKLKLVLSLSADEKDIADIMNNQISLLKKEKYDSSYHEKQQKVLQELHLKIVSYIRDVEAVPETKAEEKKKLEEIYHSLDRKVYELRKKIQRLNSLLKPFYSEKHFLQYYLSLQNIYYRIQSVRSSLLSLILPPLAKWYEARLLLEAQDELSKIAIPLEMSEIGSFDALEEAFSKLRVIERELLNREDLTVSYEKYKSDLELTKRQLDVLNEELEKLKVLETEKRVKESFRDKTFIEWNYVAYTTSLDVMWQYALFHSTRVCEFLALLRDTLHGVRNLESKEYREAIYLFEKSARESLYWSSFVFPIFCANLYSFTADFPFMLNDLFDMAFIDEAGYVEPHFALPVLYRSKKLIIAGDSRQLQPPRNLTMSQIDEFHKMSYSDSALEETFSPALITALDRAAMAVSGSGSAEDGYFGKLRCCRRSHPNIVKFFSKIGGYNLVAEHKEGSREAQLAESVSPKRILYYRVSPPTKGRWTENLNEVKAVSDIVDYLLSKGFDASDIAVITPYTKQERRLYAALKNRLRRENIGSVHKFQGREATVVVFSPVIWNADHRKIFFSSGSNLLNTAASRARSLFIVACALDVLLEAPRWVKVFADALIEMGEELVLDVTDDSFNIEDSSDSEEDIESFRKLSSEAMKSALAKKKEPPRRQSRLKALKEKRKKLLSRKKRTGAKNE